MVSIETVTLPVTTWLSQRTKRERLLVKGGALLLVALIVGYGLVNPSWQFRSVELERHQGEVEALQWLQNAIGKGLSLDNESPSTSQENLIRTLTRTAASYQITLSRQQPSGSGIAVEIREHPFNNLVQWLDSLHQMHGVKVRSATISSREPGIVDARLILQ